MAVSRTGKIILIIGGIFLALVIVLVVGIGLLFASLGDNDPDIKDNSVLTLNIEGSLPDFANEDPIANRFFGTPSQSLTGLLTQFKKAKSDKRIKAVMLDVGLLGTGWAKADEIRDAITDFRTSGKPVYAFMEVGTDKEYYIASACDRVYVAPVGDLYINGLAAEVMFFRGSLDKLGIEMDYHQIGKYKNAPDQYTRKEMSEAHREVVNAVLDDIFNRYVDAVAKSRRKSVEDIRMLIDNAPIRSRDAQEAGLIDGASYREDVENELKNRLGYKESDKLRVVKESEYRRVKAESLDLNQGERIAVIYASGPIGMGKSQDGSFGGEQSAGSDTLVKALRDAREDKGIKAIVLRVDSPGGISFSSDIIWQAVEEAKKKKPVVASMSDAAASGGYYISMGANRIVAEPSTITGSIGVYAGKPVVKGFFDWIGVSTDYVLRGKNAGFFRVTEKFTPEERKKFEAGLERFYRGDFVPKAAKGRNRDEEYIDSIAQGRVWTGTQAKERGLVDEIGGLERAVEVAKELAKIPADKGVRRVVFPAPRTFFQELFGGDNDASVKIRYEQQAALNALPEDVRRTLKYAKLLDHMKRGEVMAMLPFEIRIE
jgi:protease-4